MMQGDSYGLPLELFKGDGSAVSADDVDELEISIGCVTKTYGAGEVLFDAERGRWIFPLTQLESFAFPAARVKAQVRVVWRDGGVEGASLGRINVAESISRRVL